MMPPERRAWRHVTFSVHRAWIPGDTRGFRSRAHRIQSSGDYQSPPPADEHRGLRRYNESRTGPAHPLPHHLRGAIADALLRKLVALGAEVSALAVSAEHVHILALLPSDVSACKRTVGQAKGFASWSVRGEIPGQLWGDGGGFRLVADEEHLSCTYRYVRDKQGDGAYVWTLADGHLGFQRTYADAESVTDPGLKPPA